MPAGTMAQCPAAPPYSDRIAQAFHLIPFLRPWAALTG